MIKHSVWLQYHGRKINTAQLKSLHGYPHRQAITACTPEQTNQFLWQHLVSCSMLTQNRRHQPLLELILCSNYLMRMFISLTGAMILSGLCSHFGPADSLNWFDPLTSPWADRQPKQMTYQGVLKPASDAFLSWVAGDDISQLKPSNQGLVYTVATLPPLSLSV